MRFSDEQPLVRSAHRAPYLTREREAELVDLGYRKGDQGARDQLILSHLRLSLSVASRFRNYGLPLGDLIQEGNIGLLEAAKRFDPAFEARFCTYATLWMRAAIQNYVLSNWSMVKHGTSAMQKTLFFKLRQTRARIEARGPASRHEIETELARQFGVSRAMIETGEARMGADVSLNHSRDEGDEGTDPIELLIDGGPRPDEIAEARSEAEHRRTIIERALEHLDERERIVVRARRLCDEDDVATLAELSVRLGVSRERVRQIEEKALMKLKEAVLFPSDPTRPKMARSGPKPRALPSNPRPSFARSESHRRKRLLVQRPEAVE